ncbi:MAG: hypothetical protein KA715_14360 [Xanthomonadaceae bacterium]|nr:hypothetical protein [Xanthomonadaceae bacterium]
MSQTKPNENLAFFNQKLTELLNDKAYTHKYVVISNKEIKNVFDTFSSALEFASANFTQGDFLIQQVVDQKDQINFLRSAV